MYAAFALSLYQFEYLLDFFFSKNYDYWKLKNYRVYITAT